MSVLTRVRDALFGSASTGFTAVATHSGVEALGATQFTGFDDPAMVDFLRGGSTSQTGVPVNERMALRNSAVYRAANLVSSCLAMLGVQLFEWVETEVKSTVEGEPSTTQRSAEKAIDHHLYNILFRKPNGYQTAFEFWSYMTLRAQLDGIAYAKKLYKINASIAGGRELIALRPLDPKSVTFKLVGDTIIFNHNGETILARDMFWFRAPVSSDGVTGAKLLDVAIETIALAHQAQKASSNVLRNGAIVGGVLQHPKALDEPAINRLRTQFEDRQSSPENAGKWIVAEDGLEAKPFGHTLREAQNNEQQEFLIAEVGRFTGVPRPLLGMDETSWGTGIEQLGLFFITYCLLSWFVNIEQAIARSLLSEAEQDKYFAKFNDGALLRGSLESQSNFFSKALGAGGGRGWMTQNEVRDKFNQNPKDGGDELPQPITKGQTGTDEGDGAGGETPPGTQPAGKPSQGNDRNRSK